MIEIKPNSALTAHKVASGHNEHGPWELIAVKEEGRGRKTLTIWPSKVPSGVAEGTQFVLTSIDVVKFGAKKGRDGEWHDEVSVRGPVIPLASYGTAPAAPGSYNPMDDNGDLPF